MTPPPVPECLQDGVPQLLETLANAVVVLFRSPKGAGPELTHASMSALVHARLAIQHLAAAADYERQRPRAELELHDLRLIRQLLDGEGLSDMQVARLAAVLDEAIQPTTD
jgi:hypothetical protein